MLTVQKLNTKGKSQISNYLADDNYYTKEEGLEQSLWYGKGAEILELEGSVDAKIFNELLDGKIGNIQLGRKTQTGIEHRPGVDLTFSAPKSVSILSEVYGDVAVRNAHLKAVKRTLDTIEKQFIETRLQEEGVSKRLFSKNALFAIFHHDVSRELDPNTHSHCILLNATHTPGGWRSITNDAFYKRKIIMELGTAYRMNLAKELVSLGYSLRQLKHNPSLFEIEGLPEDLLNNFSKRSNVIKQYFKDNNLHYDPVIAKHVSMLTRKKKESLSREELKELWNEQIQDIDFNPGELKKENKAKKKSIKKITEFAIEHLLEKDMGFSDVQLIESINDFSLGEFYQDEVYQEIKRLKEVGKLLPAKALDEKNPLWTTLKAKALEEKLIETVLQNKGRLKPLYNHKKANPILDKSILNSQQKKALLDILKFSDRFTALQGDPGVGKTTALETFKKIVNKSGYEIIGLAPSYETMSELSSSLKIQGMVVDNFLVNPKSRTVGSRHKSKIWLVDEAGMLSTEKKIELMEFAIAENARIIFSGDHQQLESVGAGRAFKQILDAKINTATLNKRLRQKNDAMINVVDHVLNKNYDKALDVMSNNNMIVSRGSEEIEAIDHLVNEWESKNSLDRENTLVVTPTNIQRDLVNNQIRSVLKKENSIGKYECELSVFDGKTLTNQQKRLALSYQSGDVLRLNTDIKATGAFKNDYFKRDEYFDVVATNDENNTIAIRSRTDKRLIILDPSKRINHQAGHLQVFENNKIKLSDGDKIKWLDNKNKYGLKRNTPLEVLRVGNKELRVKTIDGRIHNINLQMLNNQHFQLDYARTAYGVQGKTKKEVLALMTSWRRNTVNQRSFMVAITRASHNVRVITNSISALRESLYNRTGDNSEALTKKEFNNRLKQKKERGRSLI